MININTKEISKRGKQKSDQERINQDSFASSAQKARTKTDGKTARHPQSQS